MTYKPETTTEAVTTYLCVAAFGILYLIALATMWEGVIEHFHLSPSLSVLHLVFG